MNILIINGGQEVFNNHEELVTSFVNEIIRFMDGTVPSPFPKESWLEFELNGFFNYIEGEDGLDDYDSNAKQLILSLLNCLWIEDIAKREKATLDLVKESFEYTRLIEDTEETISFSIIKNDGDIVLDLVYYSDCYPEMTIKTNAFLLRNDGKKYFKSTQYITMSEEPKELGKQFTLDISFE